MYLKGDADWYFMPLLCTWQGKWGEQPPKVMSEAKDETTFSYANAYIQTCGSDLWSNRTSNLITQNKITPIPVILCQ